MNGGAISSRKNRYFLATSVTKMLDHNRLETYIYPNVSKGSAKAYKNIFKNHFSIANVRLKDLNQLMIQKAISSEKGHWDIQRRMRLYFGQMLETAKENKLIAVNPCYKITIPKKPPSGRRPLSTLEKRLIWSADLTQKQKAYLLLLFYTGMRRGESLALTRDDVDFDKMKIHVKNSLDLSDNQGELKITKSKDGDRWLDIYDGLEGPLREYMTDNPGFYLFAKADGNVMSKTAFRRFWDSILIRLNTAAGGTHHYSPTKQLIFDDNRIPGLTPHIFRHNFATMLYYSGVDMKEAVRLMGHSDEKMIMEIYAHLDKLKSNSRSKLNNYINQELESVI